MAININNINHEFTMSLSESSFWKARITYSLLNSNKHLLRHSEKLSASLCLDILYILCSDNLANHVQLTGNKLNKIILLPCYLLT